MFKLFKHYKYNQFIECPDDAEIYCINEIPLNHLSITRVKKRIAKTLLNLASRATHKQLSDHSVKSIPKPYIFDF